MAIIDMDGFDYYAVGHTSIRGWTPINWASMLVGRHGVGQSALITGTGSTRRRTYGANYGTMSVVVGVMTQNAPGSNALEAGVKVQS